MYRRHSSSACVHFGKPTLEALEDRVLLSQLGDTLGSFASHTVYNQANVRDWFTLLQSEVQNPPNDYSDMDRVFDEVGHLAAAANNLQQQAAFFTTSLLQGIVQGQLDANEVGPLLDKAIDLVQQSLQAQTAVVAGQQFAVLASINIGFSNSPGSSDGGSLFDFSPLNGLADEVVGGVISGLSIF